MGRLVQWIVVILGVLTVFGYLFLELAPIEMVRNFPRPPFRIPDIGAHFLMSFGLSVATFIVVRQVKRHPLSSKDIFWTAIALLLFIIAGEIPGTLSKDYPPENLILRDVDGPPIYVAHPKPLQIGKYI